MCYRFWFWRTYILFYYACRYCKTFFYIFESNKNSIKLKNSQLLCKLRLARLAIINWETGRKSGKCMLIRHSPGIGIISRISQRDLFTSVYKSIRMLELPSHENLNSHGDVCYVYVKIIRNLFTRVSLRFDVRKGNSKKNDDWGYGEPFGGEFPHFQFSPSFSVVHPDLRPVEYTVSSDGIPAAKWRLN